MYSPTRNIAYRTLIGMKTSRSYEKAVEIHYPVRPSDVVQHGLKFSVQRFFSIYPPEKSRKAALLYTPLELEVVRLNP